MKNTPYVSIVAILVCVKCMKSNVNKPAASSANSDLLNSRFPNTYMIGTMPMPNSTPIIRHPIVFMPNTAMPIDIITFPSGGCEFSYGLIPFRCSYAVLPWYSSSKYIPFRYDGTSGTWSGSSPSA